MKKNERSIWLFVDNPEFSKEFITFLLISLGLIEKEEKIYYEKEYVTEYAQNSISCHFTGFEQIKGVSHEY